MDAPHVEEQVAIPQAPPTAPPAAPSDGCPVCHSPKWRSRKELKLYETRVCKKCYYGLANRRQIAFVIDIIAITLAQFAILGFFAIVYEDMALSGSAGLDVLATAIGVVFLLAFPFKDGFGGHSPGKSLMGVQVVAAETLQPISFALSFKRNLPILVFQSVAFVLALAAPAHTILPNMGVFILLLVMAYQLNRGPRWGDRLAGTKVIWKKYRHRVPFDTSGLLCQECGYNLTGNVSGVCPECGRSIVQALAANAEQPGPQQTPPTV